MKRKEPARGVMAGIKQDAKAAALASTTGEYSAAPQGVGAAWTHNFLNQKPWHPLNFRNQAKVFEAETQAAKELKDRSVAKAEFEAEQEFLHTLSYLSKEEQKKHQERQSVSWMYQKPAGLDAANSKVEQSTSAAGPDGSAAEQGAGVSGAPPTAQSRPGAGGKGYVTNVLQKSHASPEQAAVTALANDERLQIKHVSGSGRRSPPRGGFDLQAQNQQFVVALDGEEEEGEEGEEEERAEGEEAQRKRSKQSKKEKLREAEEVLRRAGILPASAASQKAKKKHKEKDKEKKSGKSKESRRDK